MSQLWDTIKGIIFIVVMVYLFILFKENYPAQYAQIAKAIGEVIADIDKKIPPSSWALCEGRSDQYTVDQQIEGCTSIINGGREKSKNMSIAFYNRGIGYYQKKQYDLAIKDYDDAIRLDPLESKSYHNRGVAYQDKGQLGKADQDFATAKRLERR